MKIDYLKETPRKLKEFPVENELNLSEQEVTDVAEIFNTPLTGAYNCCLLYTSPSPRD